MHNAGWYRGNPPPGTKFSTACVDIRNVKAEFLAVELQIKSANLSMFPVSDFSGSTTAVLQGRPARKGDLLHADYCNFVNF